MKMPITSVGSWIPTIDEFLTHWGVANSEAPTDIILLGGYDIDQLDTDRTALVAAIADVETKDNLRQTAAGDRDVKRNVVRPRILQFGPQVRGTLPGTRYLRSVPKTPQFQDSPGTWRKAMDDMANLWTTINTNTPAIVGFVTPLKLAAGYVVATFNTDRAALDTAFSTVTATDQNAQQARAQRDSLFAPIYERLKQYRQVVAGTFAADSPVIATLPRLTPAAGSTPAPVSLSGSYDEDLKAAHLVWSESTNPDLDYYSIRYHPGPKYKAAEEQTVDSVLAGTTEFDTDYGLPANGSVAWFKVYVVTTTSNEKGSNAVKVIRTSD